LPDVGETYLAADEETEAEPARITLINLNLRFASTRSYDDKPKMKLRQFKN
jgi:hypothetical protein